MIELQAGHASEAVRALFPRAGGVWRRCFTVLDGTATGRVLTDDAASPTWAAVQEYSDDASLFLGGALTRAQVGELLVTLRRERIVVLTLGLGADEPLLALLPEDLTPDYDAVSIDFEARAAEVDLEPLCVVPEGLRLVRVDLELLPKLEWGPWAAPSAEAALRNGLGFCLLDGERVVAEAYAGPITGGELEMGTITHADYRRRGLARVVCARTILECERQGHRTWWNASATNEGSLQLARGLGYQVERPHRVLAWYQVDAGV